MVKFIILKKSKYLIDQGYNFKTYSDTEVILKLYAKDGPSFVSKLRGMYAFAIWDNNSKKLLLFRDPLGIKPLYFYSNGNNFYFASQVKAIYKNIYPQPSIENAGLVGFLSFR